MLNKPLKSLFVICRATCPSKMLDPSRFLQTYNLMPKKLAKIFQVIFMFFVHLYCAVVGRWANLVPRGCSWINNPEENKFKPKIIYFKWLHSIPAITNTPLCNCIKKHDLSHSRTAYISQTYKHHAVLCSCHLVHLICSEWSQKIRHQRPLKNGGCFCVTVDGRWSLRGYSQFFLQQQQGYLL